MRFAYYDRLSAKEKAVYRRSDAVTEVALPRPAELAPLAETLRQALLDEDRKQVERAVNLLSAAMLDQLGVPAVTVSVLAVRPTLRAGELHGLYTREVAVRPRIQVWMRTVAHRRVVAFRTFLRTLVHELGHHLDYELLALPDSFHTEGFFKRESSLVRQIAGPGPRARH